jgi:hypothetical protein
MVIIRVSDGFLVGLYICIFLIGEDEQPGGD